MATYFNLVFWKGLFESNPSLTTPQDYNLWYSQCALLGSTKKTSEGIFCYRLNIHINFVLVLFKGIVGKELTEEYTLKKCTRGCIEGALSGCTKAESLRTRWYVLSKIKACRIIIEFLHFYAACFILPFLLIKFFKTVREILHLLTLYSKLIFWGALKKVLMVSDSSVFWTKLWHFLLATF